jgi:hypothetical protein
VVGVAEVDVKLTVMMAETGRPDPTAVLRCVESPDWKTWPMMVQFTRSRECRMGRPGAQLKLEAVR